MKRLYARLVLWLIRPALEDVERRMVERIEREAMMRIDGDITSHVRLEKLRSQAAGEAHESSLRYRDSRLSAPIATINLRTDDPR